MRTKQSSDGRFSLEEEKKEALLKTKTALAVEKQAIKETDRKAGDVAAVLKRQEQELKSPLSKMAQWVGELAWYQHLIFLTVVVAAGAILGLFLNAIVICAIVAGVLYIACTVLLKVHHHYEKSRIESMIKMTTYAENQLNNAIEEAQDLGADLQNLALGLKEAGQTMEGFSEAFVEQVQQLEEQTQATEAMNQQFNQVRITLEDSTAKVDQTNEQIGQSFARIHDGLAENIAHLNKAEQAITSSSLAIQQSTATSATVQESLAQQVTTFGSMVETIKENSSIGFSFLEQVKESTRELAETMQETAVSREKAKLTLELADQQIRSTEQLIKEFPENRKCAEEDSRRREETFKELEENERKFQEALARLLRNEEPVPKPDTQCTAPI